MYKACIQITLRPSILDPQGKATQSALHNLGFNGVEKVRMGKYVELWINTEDEDEAHAVTNEACNKLMANPVMEDYSFTLESVQ